MCRALLSGRQSRLLCNELTLAGPFHLLLVSACLPESRVPFRSPELVQRSPARMGLLMEQSGCFWKPCPSATLAGESQAAVRVLTAPAFPLGNGALETRGPLPIGNVDVP